MQTSVAKGVASTDGLAVRARHADQGLATPGADGQEAPGKVSLASLPHEIQESIFAHLLLISDDQCFVRCEDRRLDTTPRPIETSILLVNRAIGKVARKVLYTQNSFVVLRFDSIIYDEAMKMGFVRFVARKRLFNFKHHQFEASWQTGGLAVTKKLRVLMLSRHFAHFTRLIQLESHMYCGDQIYVVSQPKENPLRCFLPLRPIRQWDLVIHFPQTPYRRPDLTSEQRLAAQKEVLVPLLGLHSNAQKLKVLGEVEDDVGPWLSDLLSVRIVSMSARCWDLFDIVRYWMETIQVFCLAGSDKPLYPSQLFSSLGQLIGRITIELPQAVHTEKMLHVKNPRKPLQSAAIQEEDDADPYHAIAVMLMEGCITACNVSRQGCPEARELCHILGAFLPLFSPDLLEVAPDLVTEYREAFLRCNDQPSPEEATPFEFGAPDGRSAQGDLRMAKIDDPQRMLSHRVWRVTKPAIRRPKGLSGWSDPAFKFKPSTVSLLNDKADASLAESEGQGRGPDRRFYWAAGRLIPTSTMVLQMAV